jgi:hypothetical protein
MILEVGQQAGEAPPSSFDAGSDGWVPSGGAESFIPQPGDAAEEEPTDETASTSTDDQEQPEEPPSLPPPTTPPVETSNFPWLIVGAGALALYFLLKKSPKQ